MCVAVGARFYFLLHFKNIYYLRNGYVMLNFPIVTDKIKNIEWLLEACGHFSEKERALLRCACNEAERALDGHSRENGDPLLYHAVTVARMTIEDVGLTATSAIAALLHEALRQRLRDASTPGGMETGRKNPAPEILQPYGGEVANIVTGLNKIAAIDIKQTSLQAENFRKLIVSYSTDPRVTIIKLIDRLEVMRSLDFFPKSKQQKKAAETLLLYAPLAHQLGLYNIKSEMEDLSLKFTEPDAYRLITNKLKSSAGEREKFLQETLQPIEQALRKEALPYEIKSRTKSVYSIWKKMQAQKIDFEKVYDVFATRIILDTPPQKETEDAVCWKVYSIVQKIYDTDDSRLRDWISKPKASGYRSLHMTVQTKGGQAMEVQIRTTGMDDAAERGIAAHWKYKGVQNLGSMQAWLDRVRQLLEAPGEENVQQIAGIQLNEIIVFTPAGDLRRLPAGATVLDFAFDLHTNIGLRTAGAKVNGRIVPIKETLRTGDTIEIITAKNQQPASDWLNNVVTSKARSKIKQKLREEETKRAQEGKELLERRLKNWKLSLSDEALGRLLKQFRLKHITDLYAGLANEKIDIAQIKEIITATPAGEQPAEKTAQTREQRGGGGDYLLIDDKLHNASYKLSKCCNPIYGDDVFGFVTITDGIKIHRHSCPNAARLIEKYPYRILKVKWRETAIAGHFQVKLRITGDHEPGLIIAITDVLTKMNCVLRAINLSGADGGVFSGQVQVMVRDNKQLDMLLYQLRQIRGVEKVVRTGSQ
ncbi:MAG: RelA/SpoT family protein [Prevotellaceae bacterium]|jgi:GTP pyrophosphokinase|nr:RelA/SpoT family protein [Prevotellaceae bacterium]